MQTISSLYREALNVSHTKVTEVVCTTPSGTETELTFSAGGVSSSGDAGTRYTARIDVLPQPGVDLYGILSTPGALFTIRHGIEFGGDSSELVPYGVYESATNSVDVIDGTIPLSLVDRWTAIEQARYSHPHTPSTGIWTTRAEYIADAVSEAVADVTVNTLATGGTWTTEPDRVWDKDRTQFITDLATDGGLDVYFNAEGDFVIRELPILDPAASVWTFRTGLYGNILTATRESSFDRPYNQVVINPIDETQTWATSTFEITDTSDPRHRNNLGRDVPFFHSSPTLLTEADVVVAGNALLQRLQGKPETLSISALGVPLEVGDTVTVIHPATDVDPGFNAVHIVDSWDYDLLTGAMNCKTRSTHLAELSES